MASTTENGVIDTLSRYSVEAATEKLKGILREKGITVFAEIDHSGEAEKAGMKMPPTKLLIFGNPRGGTPVMLAAPGIAIDLPLKVLIRQDPQGKTWISYNSPEYLRKRHAVPEDLLANLAGVGALVQKVEE